MGGGTAGGELAGAVSDSGGLGVVGASWLKPEAMQAEVARARELTSKPIGVNLLLFGNEALVEPVLELEPAVCRPRGRGTTRILPPSSRVPMRAARR